MKNYFIIFFISIAVFSCKKSKINNCKDVDLNCSGITCLIYNQLIEFNLRDKNTGADPVFGSNPRFTTADIRLYSDAAKTNEIQLAVDNSRKLFSTSLAREEMYLVLAGTTTYKLNVTFKQIDCCAGRVKSLQVNGQLVCSCCPDVVTVSIN